MHGPFDGHQKALDFVGHRVRPGKETPIARRPMTDEDLNTIRRLNAEGISDSEIARRLGRSQAFISNRRRKLGLASPHPKGGQKR